MVEIKMMSDVWMANFRYLEDPIMWKKNLSQLIVE